VIVVDSSVWIGHLRGTDSEPVRRLRAIAHPGDIVVGDLVLLEILQGARDDAHAGRIESNLREFRIEPMLDQDIAVKAAAHYRRLRATGITVRRTIDMIIATFCLERGHALLHDERDFELMAPALGLRLA
jgi:predicted nucleic acid-binding protein